jgi:hypothetical protein
MKSMNDVAPVAPGPTEKQSVWSRLSSLRRKKVLGARAQYLQCLQRLAAGEDLRDKEVEVLADAMDKAGISDDALAADRALLERLAGARAAVERVPALRRTYDAAVKAVEDHKVRVLEPARVEHARLEAVAGTSREALSDNNNLAGELASLTEARNALFGE